MGAPWRRDRAGLRKAVAGRGLEGTKRGSRPKARTNPDPGNPTTSGRRSACIAADYIDFLPTVWPLWEAIGPRRTRPSPSQPGGAPRPTAEMYSPKALDALFGFYSFDGSATFVKGTWDAIKSSYNMRADRRRSRQGSRALPRSRSVRPPGHHPGAAFMGGYCYINNAAVVAPVVSRPGRGRA